MEIDRRRVPPLMENLLFAVPGIGTSDRASLDRVVGGSENGEFVVGDALKLLPTLPKSSVTAWITSPPYFGVKDYGRKRGIGHEGTYEEYLAQIRKVCTEMLRASSDKASLWMILDQVKHEGTLRLLPFDVGNEARSAGWVLRDVFIWNKHKALPWSRPGELRNGFEHILLLTKGAEFKFYVDRVRDATDLRSWWVKYPERYNPCGKVPEGIWEFDIPTQGSWSHRRVQHPCPFPPGLVERMVLLSTDEADLVVDPFAGTGMVVAQAVAMRRRGIGIELQAGYKRNFPTVCALALRSSTERKDSTASQRTLERRIWLLRKLKFGREILHLLGHTPGIARVKVAFVEERASQKPRRHALRLKLLIEHGRNTARLSKAVQDLIARPPLSKYQLDAEVSVVDSPWSWPSHSVWLYRGGRFWDCAGEVGSWAEAYAVMAKAGTGRGTFPPILSTLRARISLPME